LRRLAIPGAPQELPQRGHARQHQHKQQEQLGLILKQAIQDVPIDGTTGKHISFPLQAIMIQLQMRLKMLFG
jgi:hypothetical protein